MATLDPELEHCKRTIDLVAYAKKAGYELRPQDGAPGLSVLEHPNRDRIVVARSPEGPWIYASVADYEPRAPEEPAAHALARLRHCITRASEKGSIVEFVRQREGAARGEEVSLDRVRERLRDFRAGRPRDVDGAWRPPPVARDRERSADPTLVGPRPGTEIGPGEAVARRSRSELNQRRYDWSPPIPNAPRETAVEQRLRRWREAQTALDLPVHGPRQVAPGAPPAVEPSPAVRGAHEAQDRSLPARSESAVPKLASDLNRRRYDWTPAPPGVELPVRVPRNRALDRGR